MIRRDADLDKERNRIKCFFNTLRRFRRIAPRYDRLLANVSGFVKFAAITIRIPFRFEA
ncbi:MAG: transposase [Rhizobiales bacterium]|nr:transposase [Hyphomicrobiales bacterium]